MNDLLYQYNPWWENSSAATGLKSREKYLVELRKSLRKKQIAVLTGLRRVGKTSLMKLIINELISGDVKADHIFYISLDDYLIQKESIVDIVNEFRKLHKIAIDDKVYLFFDEVTYKEDFHIQLKNIYDSQNAKIFVASSIK